MHYSIRFALAALVSVAAGLLPAASFASPCRDESVPTCSVRFGDRNLRFAHCDGAERDFRSVIVAIPGWNGSCEKTFGTGKGSVYSVLDPRRFYDWDCFDYDSHDAPIQAAAAGLAAHVDGLFKDGYQHVLFLTHSTGGIVLLEYLTQRLFAFTDGAYVARPNPVASLQKGLSTPQALMWAAPINGLAWYIHVFGGVCSTDKVLPDLDGAAPYLAGLKVRLGEYRAWKQTLPGDEAKAADITLSFLQSDSDGVVETIDPLSSWLWPHPDGEVVKTRLAHLDIGQPGTVDALQDSGYVDNLVALSKAPLDIRLRDVFSEAQATESAMARQDDVITGVTFFSKAQFRAAILPALQLMTFMLKEEFVRGAHVDEKLVDALLDLFDQEFSDPEVAVQANALLVVAGTHDFAGPKPTSAGANAPSYVKKVAELIEKIRQRGSGINPLDPDGQANAVVAEANIAQSSAPDVREYALGILQTQFAEAPVDAIAKSGVLDTLFTNYYASNAGNLPDSSKAILADILKTAIDRGGPLQTKALEVVNAPVQFEGQSQPLWRSLRQDTFTTYLDNYIDKSSFGGASFQDNRSLLELNVNMVLGVGSKGNETSVARNALDRLSTQAPQASNDTKALVQTFNAKSTLTDISRFPGLYGKATDVFEAYRVDVGSEMPSM